MKRIFKYELKATRNQIISIPSDRILSAKEQNDGIVVYALADDEAVCIDYEFYVIGTGFDVSEDINDYTFLDTVKLHNGRLMFHVFYKKL